MAAALKRMGAEEAEVEFAPRPGLTLTLDEDEQQVTLAVVRPEDRVRVVAVSLQSSKPLSDVARAVGAQRLFHDGSEIDLGEKVDAVHARVARSFKRQTGSPYLLAVCQEDAPAPEPPQDLIDETTAAALVVAHVATGGDVRGAAARVLSEPPEFASMVVAAGGARSCGIATARDGSEDRRRRGVRGAARRGAPRRRVHVPRGPRRGPRGAGSTARSCGGGRLR